MVIETFAKYGWLLVIIGTVLSDPFFLLLEKKLLSFVGTLLFGSISK